MRADFDRCLAIVLKLEGGFVDDARDRGGATNMGITRATLTSARGKATSEADVKALTRVEAAQIYRERYWKPCGADALPSGIDLAVFDYAVHSGVATARKAFSSVQATHADARTLITALCAQRLAFLEKLRGWAAFGRGWRSRIATIQAAALAMAGAAPKAPSVTHAQEQSMTTPVIETKPFWASQTIWSSAGAAISSLAGAWLAWRAQDMAAFGTAITAAMAAANAVVGRWRAATVIG